MGADGETGNAEVVLSLGDHCIETESRRELKRLMDLYFAAGEGDVSLLETRIEILQEFLQTADFPSLRSSDQRLAGLIPSKVVLRREKGGTVSFSIED